MTGKNNYARPMLDQPLSLAGHHAVITGSGRGIGAQTARELASLDATISILDIDFENADKLANELSQTGHHAKAFECDISNQDSVRNSFKEIVQKTTAPDILVNNAGITSFTPFLETNEADWDKLISINLTGTYLCTREALPAMRDNGWGRVINISSIAGKRGGGFLGRTPYSAAKAGVIGFTKALAREVANDGITVNSIAPGPMDTDMTQILREDPALLKSIISNVPMQRRGLPYEIADAVCVLCSDIGNYMTGETINVDGGVAME